MGGSAVCFGLFVILGIFLGTENEVSAAPAPEPGPQPEPAPAHYDICHYLRRHRHKKDPPSSSTETPATDKPKPDRIEKIERFGNLLQELLGIEKEAENNKEEEKKKEEKKKEEPKNAFLPKGFSSMYEFWDKYVEFLTTLFYSF